MKQYRSIINILICLLLALFSVTCREDKGAGDNEGSGTLPMKVLWYDTCPPQGQTPVTPTGMQSVEVSVSGPGMFPMTSCFPYDDH